MSAGLRMSMTRLSLLNLLYDSREAPDYSRCANLPDGNIEKAGEVREWLNRAVSKTVEPLRVPWVRIPPSPPGLTSCFTVVLKDRMFYKDRRWISPELYCCCRLPPKVSSGHGERLLLLPFA